MSRNYIFSFWISTWFQSLFYWILFSYFHNYITSLDFLEGFNPYSIGFYSLINVISMKSKEGDKVSILILLDSILLYGKKFRYQSGEGKVSILILLDSILLSVLQSRLFIFNSYRVFLRI